jgi:uncharacterized membrane protein YccC
MRGDRFLGLHLAVNVFVGSTLLWLLLRVAAGLDPIWAVASLVASSDPQVTQALANFRARLVNSAAGCGVGLMLLAFGGSSEWRLPFAMAISTLISSYIIRVQTMWRQCPITAALVIASSLSSHSNLTGMELGLRRVGEIILGSLVGATVSWLMSLVWRVPTVTKSTKI